MQINLDDVCVYANGQFKWNIPLKKYKFALKVDSAVCNFDITLTSNLHLLDATVHTNHGFTF